MAPFAMTVLASAGGAGPLGVDATGAAVVLGAGFPGLEPFGAGGGAGCDNALAFWSVTTISPVSSVEASSAPLSASAQLWPGFRHEQAALNSLRYWKAVGNAV